MFDISKGLFGVYADNLAVAISRLSFHAAPAQETSIRLALNTDDGLSDGLTFLINAAMERR
jgi:hypothetical protein